MILPNNPIVNKCNCDLEINVFDVNSFIKLVNVSTSKSTTVNSLKFKKYDEWPNKEY